MEYIYAALLLNSTGAEVTEDGVKKILTAAGTKPDDARIKALVSSLEGVDIKEAISKAAPVAVASGPVASAPAEAKKEEVKEATVSEEEAAAGLGALFG